MHQLPTLPYSYKTLEPYIDAQTMEIHYTKHHQGYIDKLNKALEGRDDLQKKSIEELISNLESIPEDIRTTIRNNGGGHYNHSLFWETLRPAQENNQPIGVLAKEMGETFQSFDIFKESFAKMAVSHFGSGWAWLVRDGDKLALMTTANQDSPVSTGLKPLLGLDLWEHAYYLKYQNKRIDYIGAWWNIVNWEEVQKNDESYRGA